MKKAVNSYWIIGDVHGCYHTLCALLEKLPENAVPIFVGDLCDRGLHSDKVIQLLIDRNYRSVLGNHDEYMLTHLKHAIEDPTHDIEWACNSGFGGSVTVETYKNLPSTLINYHLEWLGALPRFLEIEDYFITHGFGLPYYQRRNEGAKTIHDGFVKNRVDDRISRGNTWEQNYKEYPIINVFGHDAYPDVLKEHNYMCIDTGCAYGGELTALQLGTHEIIQEPVDSRDVEAINRYWWFG